MDEDRDDLAGQGSAAAPCGSRRARACCGPCGARSTCASPALETEEDDRLRGAAAGGAAVKRLGAGLFLRSDRHVARGESLAQELANGAFSLRYDPSGIRSLRRTNDSPRYRLHRRKRHASAGCWFGIARPATATGASCASMLLTGEQKGQSISYMHGRAPADAGVAQQRLRGDRRGGDSRAQRWSRAGAARWRRPRRRAGRQPGLTRRSSPGRDPAARRSGFSTRSLTTMRCRASRSSGFGRRDHGA